MNAFELYSYGNARYALYVNVNFKFGKNAVNASVRYQFGQCITQFALIWRQLEQRYGAQPVELILISG